MMLDLQPSFIHIGYMDFEAKRFGVRMFITDNIGQFCWVGIERLSALTHWVILTNFTTFRSISKLWTSLDTRYACYVFNLLLACALACRLHVYASVCNENKHCN